MKAPRLPELAARVVAWHNRHPLARRIDATQVHSIGEVQLPFASAQPWAGAPAAAPAAPPSAQGPTLAEALAQRNARQQAQPDAPGIDGLDVQSVLPEADAALFDAPAAAAAAPEVDLALDAADADAPSADAQAETADTPSASTLADAPDGDGDGDDGEAALVIPLLDGDDAPAAPPEAAAAEAPSDAATEGRPPEATPAVDAPGDTAAQAVAEPLPEPPPVESDAVYPPPHGVVPPASLARAVERRAAARGAGGQATANDSPPMPPAGRWRRLVAALRRAFTGRQTGLPPLRAAFSREFIWPLRPAQVARWAQRHGQPHTLAPDDWPRRSIETDGARLAQLRQKGMAHALPLHVLTAAIGVGDRRIRVLVGADGSILGPRAYHPGRVGSLCTVLAIGLVGLGWSLRPLHGLPADEGAAMLAAAAASATAAASAPLAAASATDAPASATHLAHAASAADPAASAAHAAAPAEPAASDAEADPHAEAVADAGHGTVAEAPAEADAAQAQSSIRPVMSDEDRYAARVEAARLRGEPIPPPPATLLPGPVYAVVGPASRQRAVAAGNLAKMQSAASRLDGQVPEHGELVESQGLWRAAWWPFISLVDAERARVLLAGSGLKAEVIEF